MFERPLKSLVTSQVEEKLSISFSELIGKEYEVSIKTIDFECGEGVSANMFDSMDILIHVNRKQIGQNEKF